MAKGFDFVGYCMSESVHLLREDHWCALRSLLKPINYRRDACYRFGNDRHVLPPVPMFVCPFCDVSVEHAQTGTQWSFHYYEWFSCWFHCVRELGYIQSDEEGVPSLYQVEGERSSLAIQVKRG